MEIEKSTHYINQKKKKKNFEISQNHTVNQLIQNIPKYVVCLDLDGSQIIGFEIIDFN